jgi:hypothetical protein
VSERSVEQETAPSPTPTGRNTSATANDSYATGTTSTAKNRHSPDESESNQTEPANEPTRVGLDSDTQNTTAPVGGSGRSEVAGGGQGVALAGGRPQPAAKKPKIGMPRSSRRARLRLSRLDPWSVMKTSFLFSIAAGIIVVVAVYVIWSVIGASGLLDSIDGIVGSALKSPGQTSSFRVEQYVNTPKVMGVTAFLAAIDVVIITALTTLGSFLYNLAATMVGGLEVTLAED